MGGSRHREVLSDRILSSGSGLLSSCSSTPLIQDRRAKSLQRSVTPIRPCDTLPPSGSMLPGTDEDVPSLTGCCGIRFPKCRLKRPRGFFGSPAPCQRAMNRPGAGFSLQIFLPSFTLWAAPFGRNSFRRTPEDPEHRRTALQTAQRDQR